MVQLSKPYDEKIPRAWVKLMINKAYSLIFFMVIICTSTLGQNRVLFLNGDSLNYSSIDIEKEAIVVESGGEAQSIDKSSILCVVPEKKASFTFLEKNNKKIVFRKKDIQHSYQGTDVVRIIAYKFYNSEFDAEGLFQYNQDESITKEEFVLIFDETQKKILNRTIVTIVAGTAALLIGVASLISTLSDVQQLQEMSFNEMEKIGSPQRNITLEPYDAYGMNPPIWLKRA
ncbi:MAG: hypothetical protein K8R52_10605 [Bacteroidales bacterium]|nr:hypothetical protein [Bacteroidales bacterium]